MSPEISIIVPVYQVEQYIENCIISICNQTFTDYEVVLVNDGTEDKSVEIAENILKRLKIKYLVINQKNRGLSAARNTGIKEANGKWIVCIDSDDVIYKDFLKILHESFIDNDVKVSIGNFQMVNNNELFKEPCMIQKSRVFEKHEMLQKFLTRKIKIISPAIMIEKEYFVNNNLFYNENIKFSEDQQFIWRVLFITNKYSYNNTQIYNYYRRPNSIMTSSSAEKITISYSGFIDFTNDLKRQNMKEHYNVIEMILPRWVFGTLRSASKIMEYEYFSVLAKKLDYKKHSKKLLHFPDYKTRLLSFVLYNNLKSFYILNKKIL